ncbi:MAG: hypothetical protein K6F68_04420 [Clostridiales bacterium]|nr:hypothetical protein [Clostridiales bacterium]
MKKRKIIATVLALLPLVLLAAGIILEIIYEVGVKIYPDPYYWREHFITFIITVLFLSFLSFTVPCVIVARVLNRQLLSRFINVITWIDIIAIVISLIITYLPTCLRR